MPYINPRNRQKRCIRKHKLVAIHTFTIPPDFSGTVSIFGALSHPFWQKSSEKSKTDSMCTNTFFLFFCEITNFRRQNQKICD